MRPPPIKNHNECNSPSAPTGTAAKVGKNIEVNDALDRIREVLRDNKQVRA